MSRRIREDEGHAVLHLIAEAVGAAGLIEGGARPDPAGDRLIEQPAVEHDVHRTIRRLHLHRAQPLLPAFVDPLQFGVEVGITKPGNQVARSRYIGSLPQQPDQFDFGAVRELDIPPEGGACIQPAAGGARRRCLAEQQCRRRFRTIAPEEPGAICRPGACLTSKIGERDAAPEERAPGVARKQCTRRLVALGQDQRPRRDPRCAENPLDIGCDDNRRRRPEIFLIRIRETFTGSSTGTNCVSSIDRPKALCANRL